MEYNKIVREYIMNIGKNAIFTDDLPVKWSCIGIKHDTNNLDLKFALLSSDAGIYKYDVTTVVKTQVEFVVPSSIRPGIVRSRNIPRDVWKAGDRNFTLECTENVPEVTFSLNVPDMPLYELSNRAKITFTVFVPKKTNTLPFSGYDFTENNIDCNQMLVVGEKKFHVNKSILSHYSPFFNSLFNNEGFEESKKEEIELKDLDAKEFEILLQIIHPTNVNVNTDNVEFLWKLADRFAVSSVAQICESFVCTIEGKQTGPLSLANRMKMAQLYNSDKLMAILLKQIEKM